jgi:purine/pyrimidine-nucleoside phosphorylase
MIKHNEYFEGRVQSLGMDTPEGYATVGIMEPGEYTFSTATEEHLTVVEGSMKVKLPGMEWQEIGPDETFVVAKGSSFDIEVEVDVAYLCYYK